MENCRTPSRQIIFCTMRDSKHIKITCLVTNQTLLKPSTTIHDSINVFKNLKCLTGDCKTSEVKAFTSEYLEKIVEPCDWQAIWHTDVFDVLVEVSSLMHMVASAFWVFTVKKQKGQCF